MDRWKIPIRRTIRARSTVVIEELLKNKGVVLNFAWHNGQILGANTIPNTKGLPLLENLGKQIFAKTIPVKGIEVIDDSLLSNGSTILMFFFEIDSTSNDIFFIGIATIVAKRPITELSLMDAKLKEYITRHLVDGRIIFCDHRISIVAGYLSEEVSGQSAFSFMHEEDFQWTVLGLRQSMFGNVKRIRRISC